MNRVIGAEWSLSETVVERLGWVLVHSLWQFALLGFLGFAIVRVMRRSSASARYAILVGVMGLSVVMPIVTWMLPGPDSLESRPGLAKILPAVPSEMPVRQIESEFPSLPVDSPSSVADQSNARSTSDWDWRSLTREWSESAQRLLRPWMTWIVFTWSIGVVLCSLRPLLGWRMLWRLKRIGVSRISDEVQISVDRVAAQLGLRRLAQVVQSTLAQVPVVVGYLRPVILLPIGMATSMPVSQLEAILAHEMAHIQRHDFIVNLLQTLVETLFFYHPGIWWLSHRIRTEREHCCDDRAVQLLRDPIEYGRALLAVAEMRGQQSLLALGASDGSLVSRIRRIVGAGSNGIAASGGERCLAALLCFVSVGVVILSIRLGVLADDDQGSVFFAKFDDGIVVELAGVNDCSIPDSNWWKPDGTPTTEPDFYKMLARPVETEPPPPNYRGLAVHVQGLPEPVQGKVVIIVNGAEQKSSTFQKQPSMLVRTSTVELADDRQTTTVHVGFQGGELGPAQRITPQGKKLVLELPENLRQSYDAIAVSRVHGIDGGKPDNQYVWLALAPAPKSIDIPEAEWSAIDVDGVRHSYDAKSTEETDDGVVREIGFKLPVSRVDRFEYRLPVDVRWVTFTNVSLKSRPANRTTKIKVSVGARALPELNKPVVPKAKDSLELPQQ